MLLRIIAPKLLRPTLVLSALLLTQLAAAGNMPALVPSQVDSQVNSQAPSQVDSQAPSQVPSQVDSQDGADAVQVIPRPKQLTETEEQFRFHRGTAVVALADSRSTLDAEAAQDFLDDLRETASISVSQVKSGTGGGRQSILIGSTELPAVQKRLARSGLSVPPNMNEEGYLLSVSANEVVVAGRTPAGVFYGLQTLKQLVRGTGGDAFIQGVRITDWPTMRWRAFSDDISRGPVPSVDYIKRQLRTLAFFKMNMHSFYMEHTFASRTHPLISSVGGSLTPAEIRELVQYARRYHIELVPEQQTFGHLHKALKLEKYNELAETPYGDVLSPQKEESYQLIADWYRELGELFPGKFFHIGADETVELGEGQSREAVKAKGVGAVYFEHLNRVRQLLAPHNRQLMFWGDIALSHPQLIKSVPSDLIVTNWEYGPRESYAAIIKPFKDAGLQQFVCPGVQNWSQIFPNTDAAVTNIRNFVRDGQAAGALGMMNTAWDDDGESLFEMTWYGVVLGAAAAWQDAPIDVESFEQDFDWAVFRSDESDFVRAIRMLGSVNALLGIGSSDDVFWRDPFTATFQQDRVFPLSEKTRQMRLRVEEAEEMIAKQAERARRNRSMIPVLRFAAQRLDHMGRRMQVTEQFSRDYWQAYLNIGNRNNVERLRRYTGVVRNDLREMAEDLTILRNSYRDQWLAENRPYWLDSILARYDLMIAAWLTKSRALTEALREYNDSSTLPDPEEFGLSVRPPADQDEDGDESEPG